MSEPVVVASQVVQMASKIDKLQIEQGTNKHIDVLVESTQSLNYLVDLPFQTGTLISILTSGSNFKALLVADSMLKVLV